MYIHKRFHLQCSICRYRSRPHSMSIPPFSCTYPCDIRVYQAVKDIGASYDALVDLFESIESLERESNVEHVDSILLLGLPGDNPCEMSGS